MAEAEIQHVAHEPRDLVLDPFGYHVGVTSRVAGLGGNAPGHDHTYVFHTPYVEAAEGPCRFSVHFRGMTGTSGSLVLRVHILALEEGAHSRVANTDRVSIVKLVKRGGHASISFEGFRGFAFALHASIPDNTDAEAQECVVVLDRPADPNQAPQAPVRSTQFGRDAVKPTARLLSLDPPTLADPVSQLGTAPQLAEPAAIDWLSRLGPARGTARTRWKEVFVLQALRRYGMSERGARGLALDVGDSPLPALMAAEGTSVVATYLAREGAEAAERITESLRRPGLCDPDLFDRNVAIRPVELQPLSDDLVDFDFLWSVGACERLGSVAAGLRLIHDSIACLRPGGLAVHAFAYDPHSRDMRAKEAETPVFQRRHLERVALTLVSRGHEVAQIKVDARDVLLDRVDLPGQPAPVSLAAFGMIVRKARIAD